MDIWLFGKNKAKQTQFKANLTQNKANSNPIPERLKMNASNSKTMNYEFFPRLPGEKTKPKQTQTSLSSNVVNGSPSKTANNAPATLMIDDCLHPAYNDNDNF